MPLPLQAPANILCGDCQKYPPAFDRCIAPMVYRDEIQKLHVQFKFQRKMVAGKVLRNLLFEELMNNRTDQLPQLIIPIPLHAKRMRSRGFDQSLELAKPLARRLSIPVDEKLLQRSFNTAPQSGLKKKEREKNMRKAFLVPGETSYRHIALVDDIMTTGSTFNAAARLLKKSGVETIEVWAVSRAITRSYP